MTFKDDVADDLGAFLNAEEFAEEHLIDGVKVCCMIDAAEGQQFSAGEEVSIWASSVTLYAATALLEALPQGLPLANRHLIVDGRCYLVISINDEAGITRVVMEVVRS